MLLSQNQLAGTIPGTLDLPQNLETLWLDHNRFAGPVPFELGAIPTLDDNGGLDLRNNALATDTEPGLLGDLNAKQAGGDWISSQAAAAPFDPSVPLSGLADRRTGKFVLWTLDVGAGAPPLTLSTSGGTGDVDLYVRFGAAPTTAQSDVSSVTAGNTESVTIAAPQQGTYYIGLYGHAPYKGVTLQTGGPAGCFPGGTNLCLANQRFKVEAAWRTRGRPHRRGSGRGAHRRHRLLLVLRRQQRRGRRQGAGRLHLQPALLGLRRRPHGRAGRPHGDRHRERRRPHLAQPPGHGLPAHPGHRSLRHLRHGGDTASTASEEKIASLIEKTSEDLAQIVPKAGTCVAGPTSLCLSGSRFQVDVAWKTPDGNTGVGQAVPLTADTGYFWFFAASNVEMVLKVLNACTFNQKFWVYAGGLTNVADHHPRHGYDDGDGKDLHESAGHVLPADSGLVGVWDVPVRGQGKTKVRKAPGAEMPPGKYREDMF